MEENQYSGNPAPPEDLFSEYSNGIRHLEMDGYRSAVRKARNALFVAGGLFVLGEAIAIFRDPALQSDKMILGIAIAIALIGGAVFVALGMWTNKKPYTAITVGLIAYLGVIVLSAVVNGIAEGGAGVVQGLFGGIFVKILIIANLVRPLSDAKALQTAMDEEKVFTA